MITNGNSATDVLEVFRQLKLIINMFKPEINVLFVFANFVRKIQFFFAFTNNRFDPDLNSMSKVNNGVEKASAPSKSQ